ncbi:MAG: hypothetical protein J3Q66DRAFT_330756 [Benniella sp.]|nr:MAG: hypothetical protein J3Q66DRAFT_330756 [Benniella sp.]
MEGCPRLQHIFGDSSIELGNKRSGLRDVVRSCVSLGLKTFRTECPYAHDREECQDTVRSLLDHHTTTLEDFELRGCNHISSIDLHSVLAKCRNLKWFSLSLGQSITFEDAVSSAWICRDIKHLQLYLERRVNFPTRRMLEIVNQKGKNVYAQIGRLVKLEDLSLGYILGPVVKDLTLEAGWLAELAGLKKLRRFCMLTDFWTLMGQAEVEFMVSNWPKLEKISLDMKQYRDVPDYDVFSKPHWRWLKEKRPHIVLTANKW